MKHTCHAYNCETEVPPKMFMCYRHWKSLTPELQKGIWKHYRPGQELDKNPSPEYLEAAREAIDYLKYQSCAWHKDEQDVHPSIGCEYCGTMLSTRDCKNCRRTFLDWDDSSFDDVVAGPFCTSSGDLACWRCGPEQERQRERAEDEDAVYCGDYDDDY